MRIADAVCCTCWGRRGPLLNWQHGVAAATTTGAAAACLCPLSKPHATDEDTQRASALTHCAGGVDKAARYILIESLVLNMSLGVLCCISCRLLYLEVQ
jgi:hypothetical protein